MVDDQVSIHAEAVPLGRLLGLLDRTAGTTSTVPPELANRNVSAQFAGLPLDQAVKKVFEGLPLDYVVLEGTQHRRHGGVREPYGTGSSGGASPAVESADFCQPESSADAGAGTKSVSGSGESEPRCRWKSECGQCTGAACRDPDSVWASGESASEPEPATAAGDADGDAGTGGFPLRHERRFPDRHADLPRSNDDVAGHDVS